MFSNSGAAWKNLAGGGEVGHVTLDVEVGLLAASLRHTGDPSLAQEERRQRFGEPGREADVAARRSANLAVPLFISTVPS
jgi:hypothetical protein